MTAEQRELTRLCAARIVENDRHGRRAADPKTLEWAQRFVAQVKPLGRPLGDGASAVDLPHLEMLP